MLIAVSSWSFHEELYNGQMRLADVPYRVHDLGYEAVELQDLFLWPKPPNRLMRWLGRRAAEFNRYEYDRKALNAVRLNRLRGGTRLVCWAIDSDLTVSDHPARQQQKAYLAAAIETARYLGTSLIRLTLGGDQDDRAGLDRAIDLLSGVLPVAIARQMKLAIENHGGLSSDPHALVELVGHFHSPALGVCLDFGNFAQGKSSIGLPLLAPHTLHVHAKSQSFTPNGEEATIDYGTCCAALKSAGYDGAISIEYEGAGEAAANIHRTRDLLEKYWA
jgi:sugar phosphate isomerase/epimerase